MTLFQSYIFFKPSFPKCYAFGWHVFARLGSIIITLEIVQDIWFASLITTVPPPPRKPYPNKMFLFLWMYFTIFLTKTKFHLCFFFVAYKTFVHFSKRWSEKQKQVIVLVQDYLRFRPNTPALHSHFYSWRLHSEVRNEAKRCPNTELKDQVSRTEIWGAMLLFGMDKIPFKIQGRILGNHF